MQSLRISTSTYDERIKASVHMLCHLLGARYTDRLGRNKNTHLIAPAAEGAKYTAAMSWGIHVVTVEWLHACVAAGERVDEAGFAPPPPSRRTSCAGARRLRLRRRARTKTPKTRPSARRRRTATPPPTGARSVRAGRSAGAARRTR